MAEFIIRPHGRLHDWVADEQGYFREEGLSYRLVGDEERENRPKDVDPATGALREVRSGAYEMYQQGSGGSIMGSKKLKAQPDHFRIRVSDYRVIYRIDGKRVVIVIVRIGHRKEVYR